MKLRGVVLIMVGAVLMAGCSGSKATPAPTTTSAAPVMHVAGVLLLGDEPAVDSTPPCDTSFGGYTDIVAGAEVVITDDANATLATTTLGAPSKTSDELNCSFPFTADVPAGLSFYKVAVTQRGAVTFSAADMAAGPELTLGQ